MAHSVAGLLLMHSVKTWSDERVGRVVRCGTECVRLPCGSESAWLPIHGIHSTELPSLIFGKREYARLVRAEFRWPAWCRPSAHQKLRIGIVPKADRVTKLVSNHVTRNIRQAYRRKLKSPNSDDTTPIAIERARKRHQLRVGQKNSEISRYAT